MLNKWKNNSLLLSLPNLYFLTVERNNYEKRLFKIEFLVRSLWTKWIIYLLNANVLSYLYKVDWPFQLINWEIIHSMHSDTTHCLNGHHNSGFGMRNCHTLQCLWSSSWSDLSVCTSWDLLSNGFSKTLHINFKEIFRKFNYMYVCVYVYEYVNLIAGTYRSWKREYDPLNLALQVLVSYLIWVLRKELRFSARIVYTFNH